MWATFCFKIVVHLEGWINNANSKEMQPLQENSTIVYYAFNVNKVNTFYSAHRVLW